MKRKKRLGEILVEAKAITPRQLSDALDDQRNYGGKLGNILLDRRFITEQTYIRALTSQLGIPAVDFSRSTIPEEVIRIVPLETANEHGVFPIALKRTPKGNILVLAMSDPTNVAVQDEIRFLTGYKVEPALALESTIRYVINDYFYDRHGAGSYRMQKDPELGPGNMAIDVSETVEHEVSAPELMVTPADEVDPSQANGEDKPALTRELKALLKLLAKKGIINPKEYLEEFKLTK